jgi:hypothetical protein
VLEEPTNILGVMLLLAQGADPSGAVTSATTVNSISLIYFFLFQKKKKRDYKPYFNLNFIFIP